jgi:hypothetical protein
MPQIVQETEPNAFRRWDTSMPVTKTVTTETVVIQREGIGQVASEERACDPYEVEVHLSSVAGWTAEELAACHLYAAVPFAVPEGKQIAGDRRFERIDGVVSEVFDVEDIPPPPPEPTKQERLAQLLADYGLTKEDLVSAVNDRESE